MNTHRGNGSIAPLILNLGTGGEWSASCHGRFTPEKDLLVPIQQQDVWDPETVWVFWRSYLLLLLRFETRSSSPQTRHYTDYAIPAPQIRFNGVHVPYIRFF